MSAVEITLGKRPVAERELYESDLEPGTVVADKDNDFWYLDYNGNWWAFAKHGDEPECGADCLISLWAPYTLVRQGGGDNG